MNLCFQIRGSVCFFAMLNLISYSSLPNIRRIIFRVHLDDYYSIGIELEGMDDSIFVKIVYFVKCNLITTGLTQSVRRNALLTVTWNGTISTHGQTICLGHFIVKGISPHASMRFSWCTFLAKPKQLLVYWQKHQIAAIIYPVHKSMHQPV